MKTENTITSIYGESFPSFMNMLNEIRVGIANEPELFMHVYDEKFMEILEETLQIKCKILSSEAKYSERIKDAKKIYHDIRNSINLEIEKEFNDFINISNEMTENLLKNTEFFINVYDEKFIENIEEVLQKKCSKFSLHSNHESMTKEVRHSLNYIKSIIELDMEQKFGVYSKF